MTANQIVRLFAGTFILVSLALGVPGSPLFADNGSRTVPFGLNARPLFSERAGATGRIGEPPPPGAEVAHLHSRPVEPALPDPRPDHEAAAIATSPPRPQLGQPIDGVVLMNLDLGVLRKRRTRDFEIGHEACVLGGLVVLGHAQQAAQVTELEAAVDERDAQALRRQRRAAARSWVS